MDSDITALKRALNENVRAVCESLFPQGKVEGPEFVVDPGVGKIKVSLRGNKVGVWSHFGGSEDGGDLIDLWAYAKGGQKLVDTLDDIRRYLGVERPTFSQGTKREWKRPVKPAVRRPQERVKDYLCETRNLPEEVLTRYKIGDVNGRICFPFLLPSGELAMAKLRDPVDGATPIPSEAGCEPILFGWQADDGKTRRLLITEGEIDAPSMAAYLAGSKLYGDILCLSVPFGGGSGNKQAWIENEYDRLQRFERIYLCLDDDAVGEAGTREIAKRLGLHRCLVVKLPRKDANDCLMDGVPLADIERAISQARTMDPEGLRRPVEYTDAVVNLFWPAEGFRQGYTLPFVELQNKLYFRPGEVTVWSGAAGSGKSQLLSHASVHWIVEGSRVCMASLEMAPAQSLRRMCKQAANVDRPTEATIRSTVDWLNQGLLIFDLVGKTKLARLLEVFDYARTRYGCDQFIVDSLMRLGLETDDYNGQEALMCDIVSWAATKGVHVHLVAHARKADTRAVSVPGTEDIKGGMEIGANAFNVLTAWRNRAREEAEQAGPLSDDPKDMEQHKKLMASPGVMLNCSKQRNGDWEGKLGLWFNQGTYQYRGARDSRMGICYTDAIDPARVA